MVEREHAVRLAAAEGGLELDHGLAVKAGHTAQRLHEQALHALGHIRAPEELHGVAVLERPLATRHLRQVGGELGVAVAALRNVLMRLHHVTPAGQPFHRDGLRLGLGGGDGLRRRHRVARRHRPLGAAVARLAKQRVDLRRAVGVHLLAQATHGVKRAPRIIVAEVLASPMRELVPGALELHDPVLAVLGEVLPEDVTPADVHDEETFGDVERVDELPVCARRGEVASLVLVHVAKDALLPPRVVTVLANQLACDIGREGVEQNVERLRHAQVVLHGYSPSIP